MRKLFFIGVVILKVSFGSFLFAQAFPLYEAAKSKERIKAMLSEKTNHPLATVLTGIAVVASSLGAHNHSVNEVNFQKVIDQGAQALPFELEDEAEIASPLAEAIPILEAIDPCFAILLSFSMSTFIVVPLPIVIVLLYGKKKKSVNLYYDIKSTSGDLLCQGKEQILLPLESNLKDWKHLRERCLLKLGEFYIINVYDSNNNLLLNGKKFIFQ